MEKICENLDDIQHSPSLLSNAYTTHEEGMFPSQPQNNLEFIYEVEVQDGDLPNMLQEEFVITLDDDKQTNRTTSLPLDEKLDVGNFEVNEELATYNEVRVDILMELEKVELEKGLTTLGDEEPKVMSIIEIAIEKHCDRTVQ